jgi:hypothetical protein
MILQHEVDDVTLAMRAEGQPHRAVRSVLAATTQRDPCQEQVSDDPFGLLLTIGRKRFGNALQCA